MVKQQKEIIHEYDYCPIWGSLATLLAPHRAAAAFMKYRFRQRRSPTNIGLSDEDKEAITNWAGDDERPPLLTREVIREVTGQPVESDSPLRGCPLVARPRMTRVAIASSNEQDDRED